MCRKLPEAARQPSSTLPQGLPSLYRERTQPACPLAKAGRPYSLVAPSPRQPQTDLGGKKGTDSGGSCARMLPPLYRFVREEVVVIARSLSGNQTNSFRWSRLL